MQPPSEGGSRLRERRRQETRDEICRAAVDLVLERGLANVTVEEIAEAANVSPRTFFNYFPTKKDALVSGGQPLTPASIERFVAADDAGLLDGLRTLLLDYSRTAQTRRREMRRMHELARAHPELIPLMRERFAAFEATIADAIARRTGDTGGPEPRVVAALMTALFRVAATEWMHSPAEEPLETSLREAFTAMHHLLDS